MGLIFVCYFGFFCLNSYYFTFYFVDHKFIKLTYVLLLALNLFFLNVILSVFYKLGRNFRFK